jgi:hypothetical protein
MNLRETPPRRLTGDSKADSTSVEVIKALTGLDLTYRGEGDGAEVIKRGKQRGCEYPNCQEDAASSCDVCDVYFCPDHGTKRRKILTIWGRGYASLCWKCRWRNADGNE